LPVIAISLVVCLSFVIYFGTYVLGTNDILKPPTKQ